MARRGTKLSDLTTREVIERLRSESDGKAVKRLVVAREYLDGASVPEIATKYGWAEPTVYGWLERFEDRDLESALYDGSPPGRPPALDESERRRFERAVEAPPHTVGYEARRWTTSLARRYLREEFGIEFSRRHVRRLLAVGDDPRSGDSRSGSRTR